MCRCWVTSVYCESVPYSDRSEQREATRRWDQAHPDVIAEAKKNWVKRNPQVARRGFDKKTEQLGMNFSTASARLRRNLMFAMAQRLGMDVCFRCHDLIESAEDISIEHKEDWLNRSPELFWDIDNIAFSHRRCNKRSSS